MFGVAPAGAVGVRILYTKHNTWSGFGDSFGWFSSPMIEAAGTSQGVPSAYAPGTPTKHTDLGLVAPGDIQPGAATNVYTLRRALWVAFNVPTYDVNGLMISGRPLHNYKTDRPFSWRGNVPYNRQVILRITAEFEHKQTPLNFVPSAMEPELYSGALTVSLRRWDTPLGVDTWANTDSTTTEAISIYGRSGSLNITLTLPRNTVSSDPLGETSVWSELTCTEGFEMHITNIVLTLEEILA